MTFEFRDGALIDKDTGSRWDLFTGMALSGAFEGKQLTRLAGIVSESAAWQTYHLESTMWFPRESESDAP